MRPLNKYELNGFVDELEKIAEIQKLSDIEKEALFRQIGQLARAVHSGPTVTQAAQTVKGGVTNAAKSLYGGAKNLASRTVKTVKSGPTVSEAAGGAWQAARGKAFDARQAVGRWGHNAAEDVRAGFAGKPAPLRASNITGAKSAPVPKAVSEPVTTPATVPTAAPVTPAPVASAPIAPTTTSVAGKPPRAKRAVKKAPVGEPPAGNPMSRNAKIGLGVAGAGALALGGGALAMRKPQAQGVPPPGVPQ